LFVAEAALLAYSTDDSSAASVAAAGGPLPMAAGGGTGALAATIAVATRRRHGGERGARFGDNDGGLPIEARLDAWRARPGPTRTSLSMRCR
jgi:hypothetical protein